MQPRNTCNIPHPGPLGIAASDPWISGLIPTAARRWYTLRQRVQPVFEINEPVAMTLVAGPVPRGTHYLVQRSGRAIAPVVTVGVHLVDVKRRIRVQVLAQALGAGVGLPLLGPGIMTQLPPDLTHVTTAYSTPAERAALKMRLRLHLLERIRLNEAQPTVSRDGRVIRPRL